MPGPKTGTTIKGLVACNCGNLESLDLLNGLETAQQRVNAVKVTYS